MRRIPLPGGRTDMQITVSPAEYDLLLTIRNVGLDDPLIDALSKVARGISELQYGEVTVKIQAGKVVWVDKFERERVG